MEANYLYIILLLPLLGAAASYLVGRFRPRYAGWIAFFATAAAAVTVWRAVCDLPQAGYLEQTLFKWLPSLHISYLLRFDSLSAVMTALVTGVGSLIQLYSIGYMKDEKGQGRFFAYMCLFIFFMLLLLSAGNLAVVFIGWEGVGLCSYLLIGFWFENSDFAASARKAFIVNRIGDAGFICAMVLLLHFAGTLDFFELENSTPLPSWEITLVCFSLLLAAVGKSAQIPLFVWLPDAMVAPTPVSALIHAATMVTAGVYLLVRMHFMFVAAADVQAVILIIALATALMAAIIALRQNDLKKVLAYSTISQLGLMFAACAASAYKIAIIHLVIHAFFKACLFLCAGSIMFACGHKQDMRQLGGLRKKMPITFYSYLLSALSLAGLFPLAGYYSKHAIVAAVGEQFGTVALVLIVLTSILTACYITRSVIMTFFGQYHGEDNPKEVPAVMFLPVGILALLAFISGICLSYKGYFNEALLISLANSWSAIVPIVLVLGIYFRKADLLEKLVKCCYPLSALSLKRFYVDEIYQKIFVIPLFKAAEFLKNVVEKYFIDGVIEALAWFSLCLSRSFSVLQSGYIRFYALLFFLGIVVGVYLVFNLIL